MQPDILVEHQKYQNYFDAAIKFEATMLKCKNQLVAPPVSGSI